MVPDPNLQLQIQQAKQLKYKNQQLSTRYTKYLEKSINHLVSNETDTKLLKKVENIYSNHEAIQRQYVLMTGLNDKLNDKALELSDKLAKSEKKLEKSGYLSKGEGTNKSGGGSSRRRRIDDKYKEEKNKVQLKTELLDQQIRILENSVKLIISNDSEPVGAAQKGIRRGLFG